MDLITKDLMEPPTELNIHVVSDVEAAFRLLHSRVVTPGYIQQRYTVNLLSSLYFLRRARLLATAKGGRAVSLDVG